MFWLQVIPAVIYLFTLLLIPESPRYLAMKGRDAEAEGVLTKLFGADHARDKVAEIRDSLAADHHRPKFADLLDASGKVRPIVWAGIGLAVFQQFVGINIVFYYGSVLWQSVGFSENDALITNIISGLVSIGACLFTIFTVDRIGRKPLLLIGSIGMAITLALMAYCFSTATTSEAGLHMSPMLGKVAFGSALAYSALFNLSWGPIMWVMLGEMFPNQIRGSGLAVSGLAQWGANFLISVSFPWMAANIGLPVTYGFYAASAFVSFFFVKALVNETKGRELEDMAG
jgi:SP family sugar:H+ symporter-like MFS transporter